MVSTFDRLFGHHAETPGGAVDPVRAKSPLRAEPLKGLGNGLCAEETITCLAKMLGSRKQRIEEPGGADKIGTVFSPRPQAFAQQLPRASPRGRDLSPRRGSDAGEATQDAAGVASFSGDPTLWSSCGPVRRRFPSADRDSVPLGTFGPAGERSARSASPPRARSPGSKDRRVTEWRQGYNLDDYRSIRVFPDSKHYSSCSAMNPHHAGTDPETEHGGVRGPDGHFKTGCRRRSPANARGTHQDQVSSIAFTLPTQPPAPQGSSPRLTERSQGIQPRFMNGDFNFSILEKVPMRRLVPVPGETVEADGRAANQVVPTPRKIPEQPEEDQRPAAGMSSPRYEKGYGLVPRGSEVQDDAFRFENRTGNRRHFGGSSSSASAGGRSLIRNSSGPLDKGLSAEATQFMSDNFLGPRRGKSPNASPSPSRGPSPTATPPQSPRGGADSVPTIGSWSWGAVSAGGYSADVSAQRAAVTVHRSGFRGEAASNSKESELRRREHNHNRNQSSPLTRWR
eukprot:gb/GFBE01083131.1/.p1 GENE.gb/GFBE01083131.1/~~gb/GFBE01083131.1/.p1  ORF type:complete len:510 (+),score=40.06 gb/GFBE01083131.1/:1-1530(+)